MITVSEDGTVDALNHMFIINPDLFDHFSQPPQAFVSFLKRYLNHTYSALLRSNFNRSISLLIAR
jgi:hypothetical protein